ncbi:MAG: DUF481 domain-containing protein [Verrucomicrobiota bacterium]
MKSKIKATALVLSLVGTVHALADDSTTIGAEPKWVSSAALGLTITQGNSETSLGTASVTSSKKWDQNEVALGADAAYGKSKINGEDETTAESVHGFAQYNRLFTERAYGYARLDALHDGVADVDYRLTLGPGAGYYFIKEPRMDLSAEAGPSFITEKVAGDVDNYLALRLGEKFNYKISDRARLWQTAELLPQVDDFSNYILNLELGIEADLTKSFSLRSFIQDSYDNQPAPGRKSNDLKWVTAIAYKF